MSEQKWVRSSLRHLSQRLQNGGHPASPPTVGRLLRKLGYSLRVNVKKHEASATHPDREPQFAVLESQKQGFQAAGWPIISVDTKKKELIGNLGIFTCPPETVHSALTSNLHHPLAWLYELT